MAPSPRDRLAPLKRLTSSTFANTNSTLLHLSRLLSTSRGIDNTLSTLLFTATLLHSQLTRLLEKQYERYALALASKASTSLLPGETVVATIEPPVTRLSQTCASLKALAETSGEIWMFMRLWSLTHIYTWAHQTYVSPPRDAIIKTLVWAQISMATTFQALENIAYLATKGILRGEKLEQRAPKIMAWSNRFWMAQILLEGFRLLRVRQLRWNEDFGAQEEDEKSVKVQSEALKKQWHREFYANAGWWPLTLHWSYVDEALSPVPEVYQGVCGLVPSVLGLQDAWRETT